MKILYVTFHDERFGMGGCEQILLDVCRFTKKKYGAEVMTAVNPGSLSEKLYSDGVPVLETSRGMASTPLLLRRYQEAIRIFRPDIIHSFHRFATFLLDIFFKKKAIVLYTEQIMHHDKRYFFRYGHFATACHESVRKNLIHFYRVPEDRVVTIPNAVSLRSVDDTVLAQLRREYPRNPGDIFALCVARLEEQKGHIYLVRAVAGLSESVRKKIKIFLAGDGKLKVMIETEVRRLGLEDSFVFLGHTSRTPEFLSLCDFLILPSLWEGLPLSVLEAYSAAKPVIVTDIAGSQEIVKHRETGLLVPPRNSEKIAEAIEALIGQPLQMGAMGQEAYRYWLQNFSFDKMIESYGELYARLMREKSSLMR